MRPVMPWYVGALRPRRPASSGDAVLPTTSGMRVCGTASAVAPTVTTASHPTASTTCSDARRVGAPREVRLDAAEHDEVVGAAGAHEPERVVRPHDLPQVAVDDLDRRPLLGEVVERVGVDLADRHAAVAEQLVERGRRHAGDVEPAGEPDEEHRAGERPQLGGVERRARRHVIGEPRRRACERRGRAAPMERQQRPAVAGERRSAGERVRVVVDEVVDAGGERLDVGGLDGREHPDAQLVAAELAVAVGVDDAVGAQRGGDLGGVDGARRGRSCRRPPSASPGRRRTGSPTVAASAQP